MSNKAKQMTATQKQNLNRLRGSAGRFIGVHTKQGLAINAKFIRETDNYVLVYDRNKFMDRKIHKNRITSVVGG